MLRMLRTGGRWLVLLILSVSTAAVAAVDEVEPNDSLGTAQDVSGAAGDLADGYLPSGAGVLVRGQVAPGDVDYLSFGLRTGQLLTVSAYEDAGGAFNDPAVGLFDPGQGLVASDDDAGQGLLPSMVHLATQDGVYRVAITGFQDTAFDGSEHDESFDYELAISVTTAPPSFPEQDDVGNGTPVGAEPVPPGVGSFEARAPGSVAVISGSLAPGDVDYYDVPVGGASRLDVALFDAAGGDFADPMLTLLDGGLALADGDDDAGPGFLASLSAPVSGGGSYTIAVTGFQPNSSEPHPETMDYELVVTSASATAALRCDVNDDGVVDVNDIDAIFAALGQPASGPDDLRDDDGDGTITVLDARACTLACDNPECAPPPPPGCGLIGFELLPLVPFFAWLRRRSRGER